MDTYVRREAVSRRRFMRLMMAVGMGTALASCGNGDSPVSEELRKDVPPPTRDQAYLAAVRGEDPKATTRTALAAIGGIERFVRSGDDVIVKPNICVNYQTFEYAATTNPTVVGTLVRLALEAGASRASAAVRREVARVAYGMSLRRPPLTLMIDSNISPMVWWW